MGQETDKGLPGPNQETAPPAQEKLFSLAHNGTADDILAYLTEVHAPRWQRALELESSRKQSRQKRKKRRVAGHADDETFDFVAMVEVPWLISATKAPQPATPKATRSRGTEEASSAQKLGVPVDAGQAIGPPTPPELPRAGAICPSGPLIDFCNITAAGISAKGEEAASQVDADAETEFPAFSKVAVDFVAKKLKALLNSKDRGKRTPLHTASHSGNVSALKLLLSPDFEGKPWAVVSEGAQDNMQAIHFAASAGQIPAIKLLLKAGAKLNAATSRGSKTALHLAQSKGHEETANYLRSRGAVLKGDLQDMSKDKVFLQFLAEKKGSETEVDRSKEEKGSPNSGEKATAMTRKKSADQSGENEA